MTLVPLQIQPDTGKLHDFTTFAVPARPLTGQERQVYRDLAKDWAVLDAQAQRHLYTMLLEGRLTEFVTDVFRATVTTVLSREETITNQRVLELAQSFNT